MFSSTGLSPSTADHPRPLELTHCFITAAVHGGKQNTDPTTPHAQPPPGITYTRFSHPPLSLATTHGITCCFLFLRVLRCFTSPRSPPTPIHSALGDTTSLVPGFPIRTSSDPRSVGSSPRHNAASHVLHRLLVPRHPPCALKHLHTKQLKILGRIKNCITQQKNPTRALLPDTRNHYPQIKHHTPPPKTGRQPTPYPRFPTTGQRDSGPVASKPNSVSGNPSPARSLETRTGSTFVVHQTPTHYR